MRPFLRPLLLVLFGASGRALISVDPRARPDCRDVFGASKEGRTIQYAMRVREDVRASSPPPDVRVSPRVGTSHRAVIGDFALNYVSIRKVASRAGQSVTHKLASLYENATRAARPRPVFWTIVRHPWAKLVSAYKEIVYQMASHFLGCRADRPPDWLCTRAWATMKRADEPARFEAFVEDVLFGPFAAVEHDRVSYHAFSQMRSLQRASRLDYIVKLEQFEADLTAMLGALLPADIEAGPPRRVIDETVARRTALGGRYIPPWQKLHIITSNRTRAAATEQRRRRRRRRLLQSAEESDYRPWAKLTRRERNAIQDTLRVPREPERLDYSKLSNRTRARLREYFEQDYRCLEYELPAD